MIGELRRWQTQQTDNEKQCGGSYVYIYRKSDGRLILSNILVENLRAEELNALLFRHTHATVLTEYGANPEGVSGRLGHKNPQFLIKFCGQTANADNIQT